MSRDRAYDSRMTNPFVWEDDPLVGHPNHPTPPPLGNGWMVMACWIQQVQARFHYPQIGRELSRYNGGIPFPRLQLVQDWLRASPAITDLMKSEEANGTFQESTRKALPVVMAFPENQLHWVLDRLATSLPVRRCSFQREGQSCQLRIADGPYLVIRPTLFEIVAVTSIDDPLRLPIQSTTNGRVPDLSYPILASFIEAPVFGSPDTSWEATQLTVLNHMIRLAREVLGEACFWAPIVSIEATTEGMGA